MPAAPPTPPEIYVGCCGWREARARYFSHFPVVELQDTFYEPPSPTLAEKWRNTAPANFQFCLKAWQLITHTPASPTYRRLKSRISPDEHDLLGSFRPTEQVWLAWERTRDLARILQARVVVFQCPASFRPTRENIDNFRSFFGRVEREPWKLAWEPRGEWPRELANELCAEFQLIHCVDPFLSGPVYGDTVYWRLHGGKGYAARYSNEKLAQLHEWVQAAHTGLRYVLFNNVWMKEDALRFQAELAGKMES